MLHRFGGVGGAAGRIPFAAGERRVLLPFSRRKKAVAAHLRAGGCTILFAARRAADLGKVWLRRRLAVQVCLPISRQLSFA